MKTIFLITLLLFCSSILAKSTNIMEHKDLSITTSGGVSLGSYQAGYLFYVTEYLKKNKYKDLKVATGASAGGINSFFSIMEYCSGKNIGPTESEFYKYWTSISFDKLFNPIQTAHNHLFSRQAFEEYLSGLSSKWNAGLSKDCDIVLGISVTRLNPKSVVISDLVTTNRVTEKFAIRIKGRGFGKTPLITNNNFVNKRGSEIKLPFGTDSSENFRILKEVLFASASFPIAFSPTKISYCLSSSPTKKKCTKENAESALFIDGGVFDNNPLKLAHTITKYSKKLKPQNTIFTHINPSFFTYPTILVESKSEDENSVIDFVKTFLTNFIVTARTKEFESFIEENPDLVNNLNNSEISLPQISSPLYAFFGFFEEDFRKFDFYLGMYDAKNQIVKLSNYEDLALKEKNRIVFPEKYDTREWLYFTCMVGHFNKKKDLIDICEENLNTYGADKDNFLAIAKVTSERIFSHCSDLPKGTISQNKFCNRAMIEKRPEWIIAGNTSWKQKKTESDFSYVVRRLGANNFKFKDLGLKRNESHLAHHAIRNKIKLLTTTWESKLPKKEEIFISPVVSRFVDSIYYVPSPSDFYVAFGSSSEVGGSTKLITNKLTPAFTRFKYALELKRFNPNYQTVSESSIITPSIGLEFDPYKLNTDKIRFRVGVRAGYQKSVGQNPFKNSCSDVVHYCETEVVLPTISMTIYDLMLIQVVGHYYPTHGDVYHSNFQFGIQFSI